MEDTTMTMGSIPEKDPNDPKDSKDPKDPKEPKDLNPARRPQRLYLRRERAAMPKAMTLLQTTPWVFMNDEDKKTLVDAIRGELNHVLNRDMDNYPRGAQIDYEKLVNDAVCKVFSEHLPLFRFEGEDEPLVCELFDVPGAAEAVAEAAAAAAAAAAAGAAPGTSAGAAPGAAGAPGAPGLPGVLGVAGAPVAFGPGGAAGAAGSSGATGAAPGAGAF
ncbi:hypothetical protein SLS62_003397 [Diatrype stigma]|uniref:Uncharacterized protein n=1 Tax=Diatrype stigma TaxID=117547 RepID=A0AAN9USJ6_9PEZI